MWSLSRLCERWVDHESYPGGGGQLLSYLGFCQKNEIWPIHLPNFGQELDPFDTTRNMKNYSSIFTTFFFGQNWTSVFNFLPVTKMICGLESFWQTFSVTFSNLPLFFLLFLVYTKRHTGFIRGMTIWHFWQTFDCSAHFVPSQYFSAKEEVSKLQFCEIDLVLEYFET